MRATSLCLALGPPALADAHGTERALNVTGAVGLPDMHTAMPMADSPWLVGLTFGAAIKPRGSEHLHWVCPEALLGPTENDPMLAVVDDKRMVYADAQAGVAISADGGCSWHAVADKRRPFQVAGLAQDAAAPSHLFLVGNVQAASQGTLFASDDAGVTWAPVSVAKSGVFFTAVAASPASERRLWLAGTNNNGHASGLMYVSDDGGKTMQGGPVLAAPAMSGSAWLGVHPHDANIALVGFLNVQTNGSQVLRTVDGGNRYERVLLVREPLRSIRFQLDGSAVVAGVHKSFVSRDGGASFTALSLSGRNACTGPDGVVCADAQTDGFALGTLQQNGAVRAAFALRSLAGPYHCPADSEVAQRCLPVWPRLAQRLGARIPAPKGLPSLTPSR